MRATKFICKKCGKVIIIGDVIIDPLDVIVTETRRCPKCRGKLTGPF